jgi:hypothetical protein
MTEEKEFLCRNPGGVQDIVAPVAFIWHFGETISTEEADVIASRIAVSADTRIYIYRTTTCKYPRNFSFEKMSLFAKQKRDIPEQMSSEERLHKLRRYAVKLGFAEFSGNALRELLLSLFDAPIDSCMLVSPKALFLSELSAFVKVNDNDYRLDYDSMLTFAKEKNAAALILLKGCDGTSLRFHGGSRS